MKWMVTGGLSGLGKAIVSRDPKMRSSYSRANGYDISKEKDRARLAELSLDCDVFVNCAFDGPPHKEWAKWGQCQLLQNLVTHWNEKNTARLSSILDRLEVTPKSLTSVKWSGTVFLKSLLIISVFIMRKNFWPIAR